MNMMNRPDNHEAKMARADLFKCAQYSFKLFKMIQEDQELEGWVQAKITKAADYIASVYHYMEYEMKISEYGDAIENADMYSESIRRAFAQQLTEAKKQAVKAKDDMKKKEKALDEERSSTGGEIDRSKKGVTKHKENPNRFSDEEHTEPKSQAKSKSAAEKAGDKAHDKAQEKDSKAWGKANPGKQTIMKGGVKTTNETAVPMNPDGATAPPKKNPKTGRYPVITSGPNKGKEWSAAAPGPTNPAMKEGKKPDFLDMDKDGDKKEPMKKAVADKKAGPQKGVNPFAKVKEAADKCNHTAKGKSCPVHGLKECGGMYESSDNVPPMPVAKNTSTSSMRDAWMAKYGKTHNANGTPKQPGMMPSDNQSAAEIGRLSDVAGMNAAGKRVPPMPVAKNTSTSSMRDAWMSKYGKTHSANGMPKSAATNEGDKFDPLKHVKNPTKGEKTAAKDVKRGSYADRAAMLKSAEKDGRLKG